MPNGTKSPGQKPYRVLKSDELTRLSDTSGVERYYRVTIRTRGGVTLTVDIDEDDFTPEKAGPILVRAADNADKIMQLSE